MDKIILIAERVEYTRNLKWKHRYLCYCGKEFIAIGADVKSGRTKSCGCYNLHLVKIQFITHGKRYSPEWQAWASAKQRCTNKNKKNYADYGGRGIQMCTLWMESFESFYAHMGARPSDKHSLDRIDNNGNYEPGNCRWATRAQQNANQRLRKDSALRKKAA